MPETLGERLGEGMLTEKTLAWLEARNRLDEAQKALEKQVHALRERKALLEGQERWDAERECRAAAPQERVKWVVESVEEGKGCQSGIPPGCEMLLVQKVVANKEEVEAFWKGKEMLRGKSFWQPEPWSNVYGRLGGVLIGRRSGCMILNTPCLCSDEEWEALKKGEIADRLLYPVNRPW